MSARLSLPLTHHDGLDALFAPVAGRKALALAVSGGPDSLALMLCAHRWAEGLDRAPRLFVYSVDHGLRPEAAGEVQFVLAEARKLGLTARGLLWEGPRPQTGVQEAARIARYKLMRAAMTEDGAELLLTAHHLKDQAETVLMRLAHGSGTEGLKGMEPFSSVEGVPVFRPFLKTDPDDLAAIVSEAGLTPIADPSNNDEHYERVRWRRMQPQLAKLGLDATTLSRFATRMGEADKALAEIATAAFEGLVQLDGFGSARIERAAYLALSPAIAVRMLARVLNIVGGRQKPRALGLVERLHAKLLSPGIVKNTTVLGCVARADDDAITIAREPGREVPADEPVARNSELVWDARFLIRNASGAEDFTAGVADYLPRHRLQEFLGFKVIAPAEAIRTAPIVRDGEGTVLSLGGWSFDERISVELLID